MRKSVPQENLLYEKPAYAKIIQNTLSKEKEISQRKAGDNFEKQIDKKGNFKKNNIPPAFRHICLHAVFVFSFL
ncbi:hypothetical protein D5281_19060 [bacterium 1xD42-62]|uniref:Uncharacterized protein n=1 Tax=Parablautia muri TaxID=2320879 RepID=A0A9X5GU27_9FIRM|nr:hypothetical protein [Parablautia muri]